jgi:hypothetical protein
MPSPVKSSQVKSAQLKSSRATVGFVKEEGLVQEGRDARSDGAITHRERLQMLEADLPYKGGGWR